MLRKFRPGERVIQKEKINTKEMEVLDYVDQRLPIIGSPLRNSYVRCVAYDKGERRVYTFHQNRLRRVYRKKAKVN